MLDCTVVQQRARLDSVPSSCTATMIQLAIGADPLEAELRPYHEQARPELERTGSLGCTQTHGKATPVLIAMTVQLLERAYLSPD